MPVSLGITVKTITLKDPENLFYSGIKKLTDSELDTIEGIINRGLSGWSSASLPVWKRSSLKATGRNWISASTRTKSTPFVWVMLGTRPGSVVFSRDYRPMTRPGIVNSRARQGKALSRKGPKTVRITARNWHLTVAKRRLPIFERKMRRLAVSIARKIIGRSKKIGEITYTMM